MENDRELLELAAKAAELPYTKPAEDYDGSLGLAVGDNPMRTRCWTPITDDGDALRLAVKLNLSIRFDSCPGGVEINAYGEWDDAPGGAQEVFESGDDPYAATRRAIVRAAAQIGKELNRG